MDTRCRIELLGEVRLLREDRVVSHFRTRKAAHLLACLALPPGRSHTREALADRFWPDIEADAGRDSLSTALSSLRKVLEPGRIAPGSVLVADRHRVRLNPTAITTDVTECDGLLRQAADTGDPCRRAVLLGRAIALYQGELVADCYGDWLLPDQRRWAERHVDALLAWAQALHEAGDLDGALDAAARAAAADPLRESACARRMELYAAAGRPADARACYRQFERTLEVESAGPPSPALRRQHESLRRHSDARELVESVPREVSPAETGAGAGGVSPLDALVRLRLPPLPAALDTFYGRSEEAALLTVLLTPDAAPVRTARHPTPARLVTVTGPGGSGKTRLALELAHTLSPGYCGRAAFVPFEKLDDPGRLGSSLAKELGVYCSPEEDPIEAVTTSLGAAPCLLVLDNLEQLLARGGGEGTRSAMQRLLALAPALRCLVTSRQALAMRGERVVHLAPLSTPSAAGTDCESVALFVDRACGVDPAFRLTVQNAADVSALCDRLEGSPLAIEMAAAWTRALPPRALRERLERGLTDLSDRRKDAPLRHRSLRATLEWSHDLLGADLRRAFAALSVFRGGWTLEAAAAVVGGDAPELLTDLAERSLMLVEESGERYRYQEAVREFAAERLHEAGEDDARERHARYYVRQAEVASEAAPALRRAGWLVLGRDYPNLNAALEHLAGTGKTEELACAVTALGDFWHDSGHHLGEGNAWADRALRLHTSLDRAGAALLSTAGSLAFGTSRYDMARERYGQARRAFDRLSDRLGAIAATQGLARAAAAMGDTAEAARLADEFTDALRALGDPTAVADGLLHLSAIRRLLGDARGRRAALQECVGVARGAGLKHPLTHALYGLASLARDEGNPERASELWSECAALDAEEGVRAGAAMWALGSLAEERADAVEAARWYGAFLREALQVSNHSAAAEGLYSLAAGALTRDQVARSARLMGAALGQLALTDAHLRPARRRSIDDIVSQLHERLGAEQCDLLLHEGWQTGREAAIGLALEHLTTQGLGP